MKIVLASSEVVPFAKTGGLADVCGSLPIQLENLGHEVTVFLPAYTQTLDGNCELVETGVEFEIPVGAKLPQGTLLQSSLPDSNVRVYLVKQPDYFERSGIYGENGEDYADNCARFAFFCRAVLEAIRIQDLQPDLLHANDWQTGLLPAYLKNELAGVPCYENIATVFTIHNLAYQGVFWHWDMLLTGLDWKHFNWKEMEFYGKLNLLKTGIVYADKITTVSPTYASEIQGPEQGCGLEAVLQHRADDLTGILNGIDDEIWNPETDKHIPANFKADDWKTGKAECKKKLQESLGLKVDATVPLIGIVGRLASQKGWSLILPVMKNWLKSENVQWAILGTGDPDYHNVLESLARSYPEKVAAKLTFSNELAHQIEAGSDLFVMPSQYEPCGLNQMYSMAYGTVPVVRTTGGLADTVVDCNAETTQMGTANGFRFEDFTADALQRCLSRAVRTYRGETATWHQLVETGMKTDWSWKASAKLYEKLYLETRAKKAGNPHAV
jgi:starch synthase